MSDILEIRRSPGDKVEKSFQRVPSGSSRTWIEETPGITDTISDIVMERKSLNPNQRQREVNFSTRLGLSPQEAGYLADKQPETAVTVGRLNQVARQNKLSSAGFKLLKEVFPKAAQRTLTQVEPLTETARKLRKSESMINFTKPGLIKRAYDRVIDKTGKVLGMYLPENSVVSRAFETSVYTKAGKAVPQTRIGLNQGMIAENEAGRIAAKSIVPKRETFPHETLHHIKDFFERNHPDVLEELKLDSLVSKAKPNPNTPVDLKAIDWLDYAKSDPGEAFSRLLGSYISDPVGAKAALHPDTISAVEQRIDALKELKKVMDTNKFNYADLVDIVKSRVKK